MEHAWLAENPFTSTLYSVIMGVLGIRFTGLAGRSCTCNIAWAVTITIETFWCRSLVVWRF